MDYILTTNKLTKNGKKSAAENINLHIKKGEDCGLIGRNGSGKTTILRILSGLSLPTNESYPISSFPCEE